MPRQRTGRRTLLAWGTASLLALAVLIVPAGPADATATVLRDHPHEGNVGVVPTAAGEQYNGRTGQAAVYTDTPLAAEGTTSIQFSGTAATYFTDSRLPTTTGSLVWSAPVLLPALPPAGSSDRFLMARTDTAALATVGVAPSGLLQIRNGSGALKATGTSALATATWYRVETNFSAGQATTRLFDLAGTLLDTVGPVAVTAGVPTTLRAGSLTAVGPILIDHVQVTDDWLTAVPASSPPPPSPCGALTRQYNAASPPQYAHVVVIMEENWSYSHFVASTAAPYLKGLASGCGNEANFHAATHPSQPNYMAATSGIASGVGATVANPDIFSQLQSRGQTWKAYEESMPVNCSTSSASPYKPGHNPAVFYTDLRSPNGCALNDVPLAPALSNDIAKDTLPTYSWITPNLCNDWHWQTGCPEASSARVAAGDAWLAGLIPQLTAMQSYQNGDTVIIITFDEGEGGTNGVNCADPAYYPTHPDCQIPTVVISPYIAAGSVDPTDQSLYSLLGTTEDILGVGRLGRAADTYTQSMRPGLRF